MPGVEKQGPLKKTLETGIRVLAIEPFYGGSHRAFLDAWSAGSRHTWTLLTYPPRRWKWRMRHAALSASEELAERVANGEHWDVLWCSDMLDLAQLRGLAPPAVAQLPAVIYFHENQLTYPVREEHERDLHFAFTNLTSALAADAVWWSSEYQRDAFLSAAEHLAARMPDFRPLRAAASIRRRSSIQPQGIADLPRREGPRRPGPLRVVWAARWEHDKNPERFFSALERLQSSGTSFRISVLGESYRQVPEVFTGARDRFRDQIDHWGHLASRLGYEQVLIDADVIVSTADHEFFGVSVVEAVAAGCYPLVPRRLAYPEVLAGLPDRLREHCLYPGGAAELASRLAELAECPEAIWQGDEHAGRRAVARFAWSRLRPELDRALEAVARGRGA